jgi:hypothetical protein
MFLFVVRRSFRYDNRCNPEVAVPRRFRSNRWREPSERTSADCGVGRRKPPAILVQDASRPIREPRRVAGLQKHFHPDAILAAKMTGLNNHLQPAALARHAEGRAQPGRVKAGFLGCISHENPLNAGRNGPAACVYRQPAGRFFAAVRPDLWNSKEILPALEQTRAPRCLRL